MKWFGISWYWYAAGWYLLKGKDNYGNDAARSTEVTARRAQIQQQFAAKNWPGAWLLMRADMDANKYDDDAFPAIAEKYYGFIFPSDFHLWFVSNQARLLAEWKAQSGSSSLLKQSAAVSPRSILKPTP